MPRSKEPILQGYTFDARLHAYRNLATGRTVARVKILDLLDGQINERAARLGRITLDYASNNLTPSQWIEVMRNELRRAAICNRALGVGGFDRLSQHDYGKIGASLKDDYRRLVGFAEAIAKGELSEAQALNRLAMYMGTSRIQYWEALAERQQPKPGMALIEARRLSPAEHCDQCLIMARGGWRPAGVWPRPGQASSCLSNCKCWIETKEIPIAEVGRYTGLE